MTTMPEIIQAPAVIAQTMAIADGTRMLMRFANRVIGCSLILAAFGLWIVPGSNNGEALLLFKLVLSISGALAGIGFLQSSTTPAAPEVEIDTARREIRVVRPDDGLGARVLQSCGFDDLSRIERGGVHLRLWTEEGDFLAQVTFSDDKAVDRVLAQLR